MARRVRRGLLWCLGLGVIGLLLLWSAIHMFPGVGPWLADTARAMLGPEAVAKVEDVAYGVQDEVNRVRYKDAPPTALWDDPGDAAVPEVVVASLPAYFPPASVKPLFASVATALDGKWLLIPDDAQPSGSPVMAKTMVHPDPKRSQSVVAIVAIDLGRARLHAVAGTREPESEVETERPGMVPVGDHAALVAAFNGGWQAIHGHYGMMVDGVELLPPRDHCCTIAIAKDTGAITIGTWRNIAASRASMQAFRQTPQCLWENGTMNKELNDETRNWGAAVGGDTIIRRSGLGLDASKHVLFYAVGDNVSARSLGQAMAHAGAADAAELDVNWTFPRFLLYSHTETPPVVAQSLLPNPVHKRGAYVSLPWHRDFFYVTRHADDAGAP